MEVDGRGGEAAVGVPKYLSSTTFASAALLASISAVFAFSSFSSDRRQKAGRQGRLSLASKSPHSPCVTWEARMCIGGA